MVRWVAFLRGVSPTNAKMPELKRAFEAAGFANVKTVLGSGNVVFDARKAPAATLARRAEAAMQVSLGRSFAAVVRSVDELDALIAADPHAALGAPAGAKRIVTFVRTPQPSAPALPLEFDGAHLLGVRGQDVIGAYLPSANGPVFMVLIEKTLGKDVTTRTWETVQRCARS
jgi:uncharacterized protein (DUF1697 family)